MPNISNQGNACEIIPDESRTNRDIIITSKEILANLPFATNNQIQTSEADDNV